MRVLMFGWEFPPYNTGGLGVACLGLTQGLVAADVNVLFVLPRKLDLHSDSIKFLFADVAHRVDIRSVKSPLLAYMTSQSYLKHRDNNFLYGHDLFAEVDRYTSKALDVALSEEYDIIHAHDWLSFGAGVSAQKLSGKPLVLHVHATEFDRSGGENVNQHVYDIERWGMNHADQVIAVSELTRQVIISRYGIAPEKVQVVHNGIVPEDYQHHGEQNKTLAAYKELGKKIVLFVGRFTLQKGPDYFLEAAKKVADYVPEAIFVMSGSGDMEHELYERTARLGIADKVLFTGFLRGEELSSTYAMADVFVMPSVSEPFGLVGLEAITNGVPVIISKQSGVSEVIKHSLKVDFWDVDAMADLIIGVIKHDAMKKPLIENSNREANSLTWRRAAAGVKKVYTDLIKRNS